MPISDPVHVALERIRLGIATGEDWSLIGEAVRSGTATILTGERAVAVGGDVTDSVVVTGDGNTIFVGDHSSVLAPALGPVPDSSYALSYARSVAAAIDFLHYLSDADVRFLRKSLRSILGIIRTIVAAYYLDKEDLQINANAMVAVEIAGSVAEDYPSLHFLDPAVTLQSYRCLLAVEEWAHDAHCSPRAFTVPVAKEGVWAMLGAPRTFLTGEIEVVGDIHRASEIDRLLDGQSSTVAESIRDYFRQRTSFRSFACWRIAYRGEPVGVLNIQSNRPDIFGGTDRFSTDVIGYIRPFCSVLGVLVQSLAARNTIVG